MPENEKSAISIEEPAPAAKKAPAKRRPPGVYQKGVKPKKAGAKATSKASAKKKAPSKRAAHGKDKPLSAPEQEVQMEQHFAPKKILHVASECVPFVKTGGLADVVGALPRALAKAGHDVRVILPKYGQIAEHYRNEMTHVTDFYLDLGWRHVFCGIEQLCQDGVTYYFVDNEYLFYRHYIYGWGNDEAERYAFFCRAVLNSLERIGFIPDVLHCHDWQSGMVPFLLKTQYAHLPAFSGIKTVFTIHNLQYQGLSNWPHVQEMLSIPDEYFRPDVLEFHGDLSFMKAGLTYADQLTTVSPTYAKEIQTPDYGERLEGLLSARQGQLHGILNGIDVLEYDPATDPKISSVYTAGDLSGKAACKRSLQEEFGLEQNPKAMLIGMVGRLNTQKGLDLVEQVLGDFMQDEVQLVILGDGDAHFANFFSGSCEQYRGKLGAYIGFNLDLAHRIYAGCDAFLMPSLFEPCGLSQLIALRYGTLPIVRETGGLVDTVTSYNEQTGEGNGFSFAPYRASDMLYTIRRANYFYHMQKDVWHTLQQRAMSGDYSWDASARAYLELYSQV